MSAITGSGKLQQKTSYQGSKYRGKRQTSGKDGAVKKFDNSSPICQAFQSFQTELDTKYARHERLVKLSRDVTIDSKKTISMLQRVAGCEEAEAVSLLEQAGDKLREVRNAKFRLIARELTEEDPYQFIRAYSPGVQEYVEAVTLLHYLRDGMLIGLEEICNDLSFQPESDADTSEAAEPASTQTVITPAGRDTTASPPHTLTVFVSPEDYILGVADLTGELMRIAINSISAGDMDLPFKLCIFIRNIYDSFLSFENLSRELSRKLFVLRQSLKKVETACYTIQVRGSEIPTHLLADAIITDSAPITHDSGEAGEH